VKDELVDLHEHLRATAERPVERTASRWLGEAEAVAADLATSDLDDAIVDERLEAVEHLLDEVDATGDAAADEHVETARAIVSRLLA